MKIRHLSAQPVIRVLTATGTALCLASIVSAHPGHFHPAPAAPAGDATNQVTITTDAYYRYVRSNGIPNHGTGEFPNSGNPNTISVQRHNYRMLLYPVPAPRRFALGMHPWGVAVNGVPFDPGAAEFWNNNPASGWQYEALSGALNLGLDMNNAHVQPTGAYHYHGIPTGLVGPQDPSKHSMLVGYAADGFPVYARYGYADPRNPSSAVQEMKSSWRIKSGSRPSGPGGAYDGTFVQDYEFVPDSGDLDYANGCFGPTPEYPKGIYHYFLTTTFPYIPRYFHGAPDPSFFNF